MDMGIKGRTALVCAASKGLGRGCAEALAAEGVNLVIVARTPGPLEATAVHLRASFGVTVTAVACDITTAEGHAAALAACPAPDILVNNAGGPPPGESMDSTTLSAPPVSRPWRRMKIGIPRTLTCLPPPFGTWIGFIKRLMADNSTGRNTVAPSPVIADDRSEPPALTIYYFEK